MAVARRALLRARPRAARALAAGLGLEVPAFDAWWLHLQALRDIGKVSVAFQAKVPAFPHAPAAAVTAPHRSRPSGGGPAACCSRSSGITAAR